MKNGHEKFIDYTVPVSLISVNVIPKLYKLKRVYLNKEIVYLNIK